MSAARTSPLVVVGAGVAGLSVALAAAPRPVLLLSRGRGGSESATALAQGGIAAAIGPGDTPAAHARDTVEAGAGHNDRAAVRYLCTQAPAAIARLLLLGLAFDHDGSALRLGREGGHGADRIVHAGGDASGAILLRGLWRAARAAGHIEVREDTEVEALCLRDGEIAGLRLRDGSGCEHAVETGAVVLATGGIGALFAASTNPTGADGGGLAMGLAAGAAARDLEFVQFHPTALAVSGARGNGRPLPLVTEALRGAGARLYDDNGRPLMDGLHPLGDLAPRDLVARRVWQSLQRRSGAWLDATALGDAWPERFPTVHAACRVHGIDPARQRIPVTPAAHFHMGGLAVDRDGRTSVRGLYAAGEVACSGVHGANRLASNSLLEGLVFGHRLGRRLRDERLRTPARGTRVWVGAGAPADAKAMTRLRALLWDALGPVRDDITMATAVRELQLDVETFGRQGRLALWLLDAARRRRGNLGAHWRSDAARQQG